ncbi:DUF1254 domain-containing protein [Ruegeria atlantica]|uniref:DUF1254 domain-containing protein n=1 Tax=Ruegeria atlantica TaxID=81569 RepID=UPI003520FD76
MVNLWLENNEKGRLQFTSLFDPTDDTVIAPQATVNYGYNWFSVSDGPAIIHAPTYDRFFSISIFDLNHNTTAVIVNPDLPILITRPGNPFPRAHMATSSTSKRIRASCLPVCRSTKTSAKYRALANPSQWTAVRGT